MLLPNELKLIVVVKTETKLSATWIDVKAVKLVLP